MIKIKGLKMKYGEDGLLDIDSLHIEGRGVCGLLGPKGSGKTPLLDVLCSIRSFDEGSVFVSGIDRSDSVAVKRRIGYVPRSINFYEDDTVLETLDFVGSAKKITSDKKYRQIREALELTRLDGMEKVLVGALPHSALLCLSVAAAVIGNPDVIIFDEPMKKLDGKTRDELCELIRMLGSIKRVIISSDKPSDIEALCDEFIILKDGKCLLHSTADEIRSKLNSARSIDIKLRGDASGFADVLEGTEGVTSFNYSVNSDKTIAANIEYSSDRDRCKEFASLFAGAGYEVISCGSLSLSIEDAYYILTSTDEENNEAKEEK